MARRKQLRSSNPLHAGGSMRSARIPYGLLALLCLACAGEDNPVDPSSFARNAPRAIAGKVLGPDGNVCNTVGPGTLLVRRLNPEFAVGSGNPFLAQQDITCPNNRY